MFADCFIADELMKLDFYNVNPEKRATLITECSYDLNLEYSKCGVHLYSYAPYDEDEIWWYAVKSSQAPQPIIGVGKGTLLYDNPITAILYKQHEKRVQITIHANCSNESLFEVFNEFMKQHDEFKTISIEEA